MEEFGFFIVPAPSIRTAKQILRRLALFRAVLEFHTPICASRQPRPPRHTSMYPLSQTTPSVNGYFPFIEFGANWSRMSRGFHLRPSPSRPCCTPKVRSLQPLAIPFSASLGE